MNVERRTGFVFQPAVLIAHRSAFIVQSFAVDWPADLLDERFEHPAVYHEAREKRV